VQAQAQPEQVAVVTQQSSGEAKFGGNAKLLGLYLGKINNHVQRAKVNPRSSVAGTVIMRFTIGVDGQLLSKEIAKSSGSKILDAAATAALDRAAPFPPIPPEISIKPLAFTQPFKFIMR
jgi:protein TonB